MKLDDPQWVTEVVRQCTEHMLATESRLTASENCTSSQKQPQLSNSMRAILVSWLIEVHLRFRLLPETLYITINLVDRYCEKKEISRSDY